MAETMNGPATPAGTKTPKAAGRGRSAIGTGSPTSRRAAGRCPGRRLRRALAALALLGAVGLAAGCSEEDRDDIANTAEDAAGDAADRAEDAANEAGDELQDAGARTQAEAMRVAINGQDLAAGETVRSIAVLREAADGLVGDPTVEGIADTNNDGFDDDGRVEVRVDDQRSCLTLPASDDNIEIGNC